MPICDSNPGLESDADLPSVLARLNRWATRRTGGRVPTSQARLLALIEECEPARIVDLARADHCSQPAMTRQIGRLESSGLIERVADPSDARAALVSLTAVGRDRLAAVRRERRIAIASALQHLSVADRQLIESALPALARLAESTRTHPTHTLEKDRP